jgi:hypothetical protein
MVIVFKKKFSIENYFLSFHIELYTNTESSIQENEHNNTSIDNPVNKQSRQRLKRQIATDVIPLVEFHDALSQSATFGSDTEQHS